MINQNQSKSLKFTFAGALLILGLTSASVRSVPADTGSSEPKIRGGTANEILQAIQQNDEAVAAKQAGLQILKAFCGADGSWRDVTDVLRQSVKDKALNLSWQQLYAKIGGDPAWGKIKILWVSYRMDGKTRVAFFQQNDTSDGLGFAIP